MMYRRSLLALWLSSSAYSSLYSLCWGADANVKARFEWHLPSEQLGTAEQYLGKPESIKPEPHSATDTRGLPVLLIITAVALVPEIAEAIVRVYRDYKYGGVVITSKDGALDIRTDPRLSSSMVIVRSANGIDIRQVKDPSADDLISLLENILKGGR
jgi:hypothetical protein